MQGSPLLLEYAADPEMHSDEDIGQNESSCRLCCNSEMPSYAIVKASLLCTHDAFSLSRLWIQSALFQD